MVHRYVYQILEFLSTRDESVFMPLSNTKQRDGSKVSRITFADIINAVAYSLGIYLLNLFLAFISPKFDPGLETDEDMEEGSSSLPTKNEEFKPFVRRLPEFKFWYSATRAIVIAFCCSWSEYFNLPVFWPVLVVYWLILVVLTMRRQIQHMLSTCLAVNLRARN